MQQITSFNSNGFSLGSESWVNASGETLFHILSENVLDFLTWFNIPAMVQEDARFHIILGVFLVLLLSKTLQPVVQIGDDTFYC